MERLHSQTNQIFLKIINNLLVLFVSVLERERGSMSKRVGEGQQERENFKWAPCPAWNLVWVLIS